MDKELEKREDMYDENGIKKFNLGTDLNYRHKYLPHKIAVYILLHVLGFIGMYRFLFHAKWLTILWGLITGFLSGQGVVLGSHRGYSHKSYKATKLLQLILIFFHTMSGQIHIFWWARDHRIHHKFSDTDADPYNASRGFFFSHAGWLLARKHPLVLEKGKLIDVSDLLNDKFVMFQRKYILPLHILISIMIPTLVPVYGWNENFWTSLLINYFFRIVVVLHLTSSVNSFAHEYGTKPLDKRIKPTQSVIADWATSGDGWHNYHHTFPFDCGMSEFGYSKGLSTKLLEFLEYCGLAYDLKHASPSVIMGHAKRHGDGSIVIDDKYKKNGVATVCS
jgi:stearoyl-CoA desaturase (delta-9 desaturase)